MRALRVAACVAALPLSFANAQNCSNTSVGFTPLNDLGTGTYHGYQGGLYPGGSNVRPLAHEVAGLAQAAQVLPRDASGAIDMANGKIGFISIGMSNCVYHFNAFMAVAQPDPQRNPHVVLANCAQGGQTAVVLANPNAAYWTNWVPSHLAAAGLTAAQVQTVWFLEADANPTMPFPLHAQMEEGQFEQIMGILRTNFPNARLCYPASRIYGGYGTTTLNPEPWAYEQGFAVQWMIANQIAGSAALNFDPAHGPVVSPWIAWGPYMWADGLVPRSDGLVWLCSDFQPDGTHPSNQGTAKNAVYLMDFVHNDSTAQSWYLAQPSPIAFGTGKTTSIGTTPSAGWIGSASIGQNQFQVTFSGGVPNKAGIAFYGSGPNLAPFLGGTLFAKTPIVRLWAQQLDGTGSTSYAIPLDVSMLGATRDYQFWFRDPQHPDGTGVGLSNGLQVRFFN